MEQNNKDPDPSADLLAKGILQIYEPPLAKVKTDLKELIAKQNRIYIDLSAEKFNFVDNNVTNVQNMMERLRIYKEKLISIKKQMALIHQRTKTLKKRAINIQMCKEKELAVKLQKQKQEEALIGTQNLNLQQKEN